MMSLSLICSKATTSQKHHVAVMCFDFCRLGDVSRNLRLRVPPVKCTVFICMAKEADIDLQT